MNPAILALVQWAIAGLPELIKALQAMPAAQVAVPNNQMQMPSPVAMPSPLGWPPPLPQEGVDEPPAQPTPAPPGKGGSPGIRLLQVALVAAGQQVEVDGFSGPKTEAALAAVVQHILSRVG